MDLKKAEHELGKLYQEREEIMPLQRRAVALCAASIRAVHIGKLAEAEKGKKGVEALLFKMLKQVKKRPRLAGFLTTPYQEYVELAVLLSMLDGGKMPLLDVPADAYVLGTLDAIGELKRACMELLARGETKKALALFNKTERVYYSMEGYSFPKSIVQGLKHKQDAMKGVLEKLHHTLAEARMRNNGNNLTVGSAV